MHRPIRLAVALTALALLLPAASAEARERHLWATVNICDTPKNPDRVGVRGRMPGTGRRESMRLRIALQYRDAGEWRNDEDLVSPWLGAGSALRLFGETGYTFALRPPAGRSSLVRGVVRFEWRDRRRRNGRLVWVVTKRKRVVTEGRHRTRQADPRNFSAATCLVRSDN